MGGQIVYVQCREKRHYTRRLSRANLLAAPPRQILHFNLGGCGTAWSELR